MRVIKKWRQLGTIVSLPKTRCPSKIEEIKKAAMRPLIKGAAGIFVRHWSLPPYARNLSYSSHVWAMDRVAFSQKTSNLNYPKPCGKVYYELMKPKLFFFWHNLKQPRTPYPWWSIILWGCFSSAGTLQFSSQNLPTSVRQLKMKEKKSTSSNVTTQRTVEWL